LTPSPDVTALHLHPVGTVSPPSFPGPSNETDPDREDSVGTACGSGPIGPLM